MSIEKVLAAALLLAAGCIPWSVNNDPAGFDCARFDHAALRYPGMCFDDAGAPDAMPVVDGGTIDGDPGDGP